MASRWDGKIGKLPGIGQKRDSKRVSPRVPKDPFAEKSGIADYGDPPFLYDEDTGTGNPKQPGEVDLYTPETVGQYQSQWARYERALELDPSAIQKRGRHTIYKFPTPNSYNGFWEVTVRPGATFLNILKPEFQILCPKPDMQLNAVQSDGEKFTWQQIKGARSVVFSQDEDINPIINILTFCNGNGCSDGSVEPIVLKVEPEEQPELFDTIVIYTTPTSSHWGNSFASAIAAPDAAPCRQVPTNLSINNSPIPPAVAYLQRAYQFFSGNLPVAWSLPTCESQFLVETIWQQNTTGQYVDVQRFEANAVRQFVPQNNTHYRLRSVFNTYGRISTSDSQRFYWLPGALNTGVGVAVDDSLDGISANTLKTDIIKLPLARKGLTLDDELNGLSASALKTNVAKLPLNGKRVEPPTDKADGISFTALKTTITKTNLGGMIIK